MIKRTIEQDGVNIDIVITLTPEEREEIYREKDREYLKEDIYDIMTENDDEFAEAIKGVELDDRDMKEISSDFHDRLGDRDTYWDIYWDCLKEVVLEYIKR